MAGGLELQDEIVKGEVKEKLGIPRTGVCRQQREVAAVVQSGQ